MAQIAPPPPAPPEAAPPPPAKPSGGGTKLARDLLEVLALAVALYVVITVCVQTVRVNGPSMIPTLQNNDLLFADKLTYHLHAPERGDIVVLKQPGDINRDIIKRIIGVPGDTIEIDGDYNLVNGQPRPAVLIKPAGARTFRPPRALPAQPDQGPLDRRRLLLRQQRQGDQVAAAADDPQGRLLRHGRQPQRLPRTRGTSG